MAASSASPASMASASDCSSRASRSSLPELVSSTSRYQGAAVVPGLRAPGTWAAPVPARTAGPVRSSPRGRRWHRAAGPAMRSQRAGSRHADPCRGDAARLRKQLQAGRGDDSQRAFAADHQALEVVAGVVLAQWRQRRDHAAIGQHHFDAQRQVAHHSVAQDGGAAGIGGKVAADLAAAFGSQAQREQALRIGGRGLHRGQCAAGLGHQRIVGGIHRSGCDSCGAGTARSAGPWRRASRRRSSRYFRPGARRRCQRHCTSASRRETSAVEAGWTTASAAPWNRRRWSTRKGALSSRVVSSASPPTSSRRRPSRSTGPRPRRWLRGGNPAWSAASARRPVAARRIHPRNSRGRTPTAGRSFPDSPGCAPGRCWRRSCSRHSRSVGA